MRLTSSDASKGALSSVPRQREQARSRHVGICRRYMRQCGASRHAGTVEFGPPGRRTPIPRGWASPLPVGLELELSATVWDSEGRGWTWRPFVVVGICSSSGQVESLEVGEPFETRGGILQGMLLSFLHRLMLSHTVFQKSLLCI